ncbi:MAG: DUF1178 family protein [Deltaproteobacteria bacterium]|nr:DUF1178 family protein [Candidatus Zymogenaceae bacterium]
MIVYDIRCENGHIFEGWFEDRQAFEEQKRSNLIDCPICGTVRVDVAPSTFGIGGRAQKTETTYGNINPESFFQQMTEFLEKNFQDVGPQFAEEALKIHYGETEERSIRGTTTPQEEQELQEEGVTFMKIPMRRFDS